MLVFGEEAVTLNMLDNMFHYGGFHSFACHAGAAYRYIVAVQASRSLFVYWCYFGLFT